MVIFDLMLGIVGLLLVLVFLIELELLAEVGIRELLGIATYRQITTLILEYL